MNLKITPECETQLRRSMFDYLLGFHFSEHELHKGQWLPKHAISATFSPTLKSLQRMKFYARNSLFYLQAGHSNCFHLATVTIPYNASQLVLGLSHQV